MIVKLAVRLNDKTKLEIKKMIDIGISIKKIVETSKLKITF